MGTGYIGFSPGQSAFFTRAMHALSASPARVLSQRFNFGRYEQLVDIGGGSGAFAISAVTAWNNLRAVIIDTDVVCRVAKRFIVKAGLSERISTHSGNMFKAQYPAGDVHLYASIFHNFSDAKCLTLLHKSHRALPKGGAVVIGEFVLDSPGGTPRFPALLNLELLLRTDQGSARSQRQYADWLKKAGFAKVTAVHVLNSFCAVSGVKVTGEPARAKVNEGGRNWVPS